MSCLNHTPFPAIAFRQYNLAGDMLGVVSVRGTFLLTKDGPLALAREQVPLEMADLYDGDDPHRSQLVTQGNLVPFKPGTDITFVGAAYTDDGKPQQSWTCGLTVGPVSKDLRVYGPREWIATHDKPRPFRSAGSKQAWLLGEADPVSHVVLDWAKAFGGNMPPPADREPQQYERNPLGCGIVNGAMAEDGKRLPAPQIEAQDDPIIDWKSAYEPQNLGLIPPFWPQRLQFAGTYDDDWIRKRHPLLPKDFDFRFWQCAHPDLVAPDWLAGDEPFELRNLLYRYPVLRGELPGIRLEMRLPRPGGTGVAPFVLDGVHFDMRPKVGCVFLTWRAGFPWPDGRGMPEVVACDTLPEAV